MSPKTKILLFSSYYLPGFKAGGPIKTIQNMVDHLYDDMEFWIVTRDRDLNDKKHFAAIEYEEWLDVGHAKVLYLRPDKLGILSLIKVIKQTPCDVLYLNSFFDASFSLKLMVARKLRMYPNVPVVLAPRGEFSKGALSLKTWKKNIYIHLSSLLGLYSKIIWQASTEYERIDILRCLHTKEQFVYLAKDLPEQRSYPVMQNHVVEKPKTKLNLIFLSRISPMKNLDYALEVLSKVRREVTFDIYGPKEDLEYWSKCQKLIDKLPQNIRAQYIAEVTPDRVRKTFAAYDLFLFPSRGENYGHVIAEALSIGTPVLLSDQTPWNNLFKDGLGWNFPLEEQEKFVSVIEGCSINSIQKDESTRERVRKCAINRIYNSKDIEDNKKMFKTAISFFSKAC